MAFLSISFAITGVQPAQIKPNAKPPAPQNKSINFPFLGNFFAIW